MMGRKNKTRLIVLFIAILFLCFIGCSNVEKTEEVDSITLLNETTEALAVSTVFIDAYNSWLRGEIDNYEMGNVLEETYSALDEADWHSEVKGMFSMARYKAWLIRKDDEGTIKEFGTQILKDSQNVSNYSEELQLKSLDEKLDELSDEEREELKKALE